MKLHVLSTAGGIFWASRRCWSGLYTLDREFVIGMAKRRSVRVTVNFKEMKGQGTLEIGRGRGDGVRGSPAVKSFGWVSPCMKGQWMARASLASLISRSPPAWRASGINSATKATKGAILG